jgi:hypothetical protein
MPFDRNSANPDWIRSSGFDRLDPIARSDCALRKKVLRGNVQNMQTDQVHRTSRILLIALSLTALLTVLFGYTQAPLSDEGTGAHIFQLSVVAGALTTFLFLGTADWTQPSRAVRQLAVPAAAFVLAFAALYYLENHYYPAHYP